jgi:hypothetical protein
MKSHSAIILVEREAKLDADSLEKLLEFFGVQHRTIFAESASEEDARCMLFPEHEVVLFASATGLVLAEKNGLFDPKSLQTSTSLFQMVLVYAGAKSRDILAAYALLFDSTSCKLIYQTARQTKICFSDQHPDLCGPFSGLTIENVSSADTVLLIKHEKGEPIIMDSSQGNAAVLLYEQRSGKQVFLVTSSGVANLEAVTKEKYFDIKKHFLELLPFVIFIKRAFADEIYKTDGVKACLIVDDPTLVRTYGHFNYEDVLKEMHIRKFTTNVGFIPWNYRRSDHAVVSLLKSNLDKFSIAVHGCDHTRAEFGTISASVLDWLAKTAKSRMELHKERHHLDYNKVMIFPQGIFSEESATALKRNNYWAAVNTDTCASNDRTGVALGEVMDLAITKYSSFPIITRRYLWHGLENFAFDILLEKPCLIVTHHQDYRNDSKRVLSGLEMLSKLNANLNWSTLGDVVQTLYKRQRRSAEHESIRIYAHTNLIKNNSQSHVEATFSKVETDIDMLNAVLLDGKPAGWTITGNNCVVSCKMSPGQIIHLQFQYRQNLPLIPFESSFVRRGKVLLRRHMTEIRDRYLS